ncbi:hypothetical protein NBCG_01604 [Nocardioidaceae bacterium Broad-1]|nr:hypothetical protein NBCG_01604 [Nocardioidaceae bacterium Broad-1]
MGVCDVPAISTVCNAATDATGSVVSAPFEWLAKTTGEAAKVMFETVWTVLDDTTFVDVTSSGYTKVYNLIFGIAVFIMVGFFLLQVISGMIRREPAALTRAALGLAKSILGCFVVLTLVGTALEITDRVCLGIVHATGSTVAEMGDRLGILVAGLGAVSLHNPGAGAIINIFLATLAIGGAFLVWLSLLVRKALLLIAVVFAPLALAGSSWDRTRAWVGRWASFVVAMILSKVVMVVIFLIATTQVSAPIDADLKSISDPIAGIVLMLVAGFAPYIAYKAISFMGFDMYHAMSAEQETKQALNRPIPLPNKRPPVEAKQVLDSGGSQGSSGSSTSSSPSGPQSTPVTPGAAETSTSASTQRNAAGATAPPVAAALVGAEAVQQTTGAAKRVGESVAGAAEQHATPASEPSDRRPPMPQPADTTLDRSGGEPSWPTP